MSRQRPADQINRMQRARRERVNDAFDQIGRRPRSKPFGWTHFKCPTCGQHRSSPIHKAHSRFKEAT